MRKIKDLADKDLDNTGVDSIYLETHHKSNAKPSSFTNARNISFPMSKTVKFMTNEICTSKYSIIT